MASSLWKIKLLILKFFCPPVQIHDQYQSEFMFPSAQHCGPSPIVKKGVRILASSCEPLAIYIYIRLNLYAFIRLCLYLYMCVFSWRNSHLG